MGAFSTIDPNFHVESSFEQEGLAFFDAGLSPFSLHGLLYEEGIFRRLPRAVAGRVSPEVAHLSLHTAGGRVRFCTDSPVVAIRAEMHTIEKMPHFALTGSGGFDLFEKSEYLATFMPPFGFSEGFSSKKALNGRKMRELTLNFPLYSGVKRLYIGVVKDSVLQPAPAYNGAPVVFYGSSITQGGCASKPGCAFPAMVSQMLGCDHVNLGFSGSCKGEPEMVEYLAGLDMSAFVCGYDHNAPTLAHLARTHLPLVQAVRAAHPHIPILLLNRPKAVPDGEEQQRLDVIRATCQAVGGLLLTGDRLIPADITSWATVDGVHPNDLGFWHMAKAVAELLPLFPV